MAFLVLRAQAIERVLPVDACIEVMAEALAGLSRGELDQPLRTVYPPPVLSSMGGSSSLTSTRPP